MRRGRSVVLRLLAAGLYAWTFFGPSRIRPGGVRFLFDCGAFTDQQLTAISLQEGEIQEHRFAENRVGAGLTLAPPTPPDVRVRIRRFAQHSRKRR